MRVRLALILTKIALFLVKSYERKSKDKSGLYGKDKWTVVDIHADDVPVHLESRILSFPAYIDVKEKEHLYDVHYLLGDVVRLYQRRWNEEETKFLNEVKNLMVECDAFYFRIIR